MDFETKGLRKKKREEGKYRDKACFPYFNSFS